ncbi:MAG: hypothetical protein AB4426_33020 [Xenococcaceae cyanobacterium]
MSQTPLTVTYSLEEVLGQINHKLDRIDEKFETKLDTLQQDVTEIKIGQAKLEGEIKRLEIELKGEIKTLEAEVKGIGKRLDTQEFINRSVVVGFVLAVGAGMFKLFFPNFPG